MQSCRSESKKEITEDSIIKVVYYLTDEEYREKDKFIKEFNKAISENDAGTIIDAEESKRVIETTIRIKDLASINKIKRIFIDMSPGTKYRIEQM